MSEPNKYRIEHVSDFLKVPLDRQAACLEEFDDFLETMRAIQDLVAVAGQAVGIPNAGCIADAFIWADDGKKNRTIRLLVDAIKEKQQKGAAV